jgi:uncharacterized repeat protein (TIGR02543 family)
LFVLNSALTIPAGTTLNINAAFNIGSGGILTNQGTIVNNALIEMGGTGAIVNNGTIDNASMFRTLSSTVSFTGTGSVNNTSSSNSHVHFNVPEGETLSVTNTFTGLGEIHIFTNAGSAGTLIINGNVSAASGFGLFVRGAHGTITVNGNLEGFGSIGQNGTLNVTGNVTGDLNFGSGHSIGIANATIGGNVIGSLDINSHGEITIAGTHTCPPGDCPPACNCYPVCNVPHPCNHRRFLGEAIITINGLQVHPDPDTGLRINGGIRRQTTTTIVNAINAAFATDDIVTVTGEIANVAARLEVTVPTGKTLIWAAVHEGATWGNAIEITNQGTGTFELAAGASISNSGMSSLNVTGGNIIISGGNITTAFGAAGRFTATDSSVTVTSNYTGGLELTGGSLNLDTGTAPNAILDGASLDISAASGDRTIARLLGDGSITLGSNTLTINQETDTTYSGAISGAGQFVKLGDGTLTLSGNNSAFAGTLTIDEGTLAVTASADLGGGFPISPLIIGNATLRIDENSVSVFRPLQLTHSNSTIEVTSGNTFVLPVNGSGSGRLNKTGAGTLEINDTITTGTGGTTIHAGTINLRFGTPLLPSGDVINNGTLQFSNDYTFNHNYSGNGSIIVNSSGNNLTIPAGYTVIVNGTLSNNGIINVNGTLFKNSLGAIGGTVNTPGEGVAIWHMDTVPPSAPALEDAGSVFDSNSGTDVKWFNDGTNSGIWYERGTNIGFLPVSGVTVSHGLTTVAGVAPTNIAMNTHGEITATVNVPNSKTTLVVGDIAPTVTVMKNAADEAITTLPLAIGNNIVIIELNSLTYIITVNRAPYNIVTFDSQDGSAVASLTTVIDGDTITRPTDPTKDGYTFAGWYKEATYENLWDFATDTVTENITLYARWTLNTYTVTFDSQDGSAVAPITNVPHGTTITAPTEPTKDDYEFDGWYTCGDFITAWNFASDTVTGSITLYAKWTEIGIPPCPECNEDPCKCPEPCSECDEDPCKCPEPCPVCDEDPCKCPEPCPVCDEYPCECEKEDPCKDGHTWGSWARVGSTDTEKRVCSVCQKEETRPRTGGSFSGGNNNNNNTTTSPPDTTPPPATEPTDPPPPPVTTIPESVIEESLKQENPVIVLEGLDSTIISAESLQKIAENGVDVKVLLENGFSFMIIADSISPNAKAFDLNIEVILKDSAARWSNTNIPANSIVINPNFSGEFGFEILFSFTAEQLAEAGINGNNVKLWHVDYNGKVTDTGKIKLNADGGIEFTISSASFYVLSETAPLAALPPEPDPEPDEPVVIDIAPDNNEPETTGTEEFDPDSNPKTGVALGFTAVILAGGVLGFNRKRKRVNQVIRD